MPTTIQNSEIVMRKFFFANKKFDFANKIGLFLPTSDENKQNDKTNPKQAQKQLIS